MSLRSKRDFYPIVEDIDKFNVKVKIVQENCHTVDVLCVFLFTRTYIPRLARGELFEDFWNDLIVARSAGNIRRQLARQKALQFKINTATVTWERARRTERVSRRRPDSLSLSLSFFLLASFVDGIFKGWNSHLNETSFLFVRRSRH